MNFKQTLHDKVKTTEDILLKYLPKQEGYSAKVAEAMNYSLLAGGKRIRPILIQEVFTLFGGTDKIIEPFMAAIEMIHTYSLVHDDLPSMDNDLYRRGKKTTHAIFGEGMAVLAGDGLLNLAFETILDSKMEPDFYPRCFQAMQVLAAKAGVRGMIGGQTADILAENLGSNVTCEHLLYIHKNKTAALMEAAMMVGAILAGAKEEAVLDMERVARMIGIAFQIQDDILDVTSSLEVLGKETGSDSKNNKVTYVTLHGLDASQLEVKRLSEEGIAILLKYQSKTGEESSFLNQLLEELIGREQ